MTWRRVGLALSLAAVATVSSACGVPDHGPPVTITKVPYDLTRPEPKKTGAPTASATARPYVYLVRDEALVPVPSSVTEVGDRAAAVTSVLSQLTEGPSEQDRTAGLSTALGPDTPVHLARLEGSVARIDIATGDQVPPASRVPLAVAQVVLTVTSVPGVDSVLVTRDGAPVELPLPGGALTSGPVTGRDYISLVEARSPGTATTAPLT
ncbi:GerMN domain-containing protein [Pedococcus bigeumensis]|uniref:GerMN domain-containing protein n=1 Tax=Pedococcus bigeumensis TaxID=433644 RepID=UPI002FED0509